MRKSILQFAKKLWSSEDSGNRRALCTNCKTDPVTQSSLCKKCCRRSTVCSSCYSRILSLHHTRLDRYGSLEERTYKTCPECNLPNSTTTPNNTPSDWNQQQDTTPLKRDEDPLARYQRTCHTKVGYTSSAPAPLKPISSVTSPQKPTPHDPMSPIKRRPKSPRRRPLSPKQIQSPNFSQRPTHPNAMSPKQRPTSPKQRQMPNPKPRTMSPKPRAMSPKPRAVSPKPRTMSPKPRTMSPKPEVMSPKRKPKSPKPRPQLVSPAPQIITPVKPPRPVNTVRPVTLTKEKSFSSSESEYQSCSENVDPDSPFSPTTPTPLGRPPVFPTRHKKLTSTVEKKENNTEVKIENNVEVKITPYKESSRSPNKDRSRYDMQGKTMPLIPERTPVKSQKVLETISMNNKCVVVAKERELPRTVAVVTKSTPPVSMVTRSRISNPNRPVMIRTRAVDECDDMHNVMVKRTSMGDNVVLKPEIILPSRILGKLPSEDKQADTNGHVIKDIDKIKEHHTVEIQRSYSESSKDRRLIALKNEEKRSRKGSITETKSTRSDSVNSDVTPRTKRTVRIVEDANIEHCSRPCSLEVEHVTVGEVTPTVYVKDKNDVIDESIQKSESVLKRSLSVSNSRLQRKLSRKLQNKDRNSSQSEDTAPVFLRRNRSSSSVDKSSPPPDLKLMTNAGLALEDIQAFGMLYVQRLENKMRNIDSMKELEKQHNISCRERLKTALDTHEQLSAGLEDVKRQLKECMEKYRFISETFV